MIEWLLLRGFFGILRRAFAARPRRRRGDAVDAAFLAAWEARSAPLDAWAARNGLRRSDDGASYSRDDVTVRTTPWLELEVRGDLADDERELDLDHPALRRTVRTVTFRPDAIVVRFAPETHTDDVDLAVRLVRELVRDARRVRSARSPYRDA